MRFPPLKEEGFSFSLKHCYKTDYISETKLVLLPRTVGVTSEITQRAHIR